MMDQKELEVWKNICLLVVMLKCLKAKNIIYKTTTVTDVGCGLWYCQYSVSATVSIFDI
jgi:hypothetical protein